VISQRKTPSRDAHDEAFHLRTLGDKVQIVSETFWLGGVYNVGASEWDIIYMITSIL
jgi:hypothetical protein